MISLGTVVLVGCQKALEASEASEATSSEFCFTNQWFWSLNISRRPDYKATTLCYSTSPGPKSSLIISPMGFFFFFCQDVPSYRRLATRTHHFDMESPVGFSSYQYIPVGFAILLFFVLNRFHPFSGHVRGLVSFPEMLDSSYHFKAHKFSRYQSSYDDGCDK